MKRCDWCDRPAGWAGLSTRTEQGLLCCPCRDAYLLEARGERQAYIYGEQYRYAQHHELPVTPRGRDRAGPWLPQGLRPPIDSTRMTDMTTKPLTTAEASNRSVKADAILDVLSETGITADELGRLDDAGWKAAAKIAAQRAGRSWVDASEDTRALCVRILGRRQAEAGTDPFAGFPQF